MKEIFNIAKFPIFLSLLGLSLIIIGFLTAQSKNPNSVKHSQFQVDNEALEKSGVVNLNTASLAQLIALPGIGEVTAQKITNLRPFKSVSELLEKKIVNKSTFQKLEGLVSVD